MTSPPPFPLLLPPTPVMYWCPIPEDRDTKESLEEYKGSKRIFLDTLKDFNWGFIHSLIWASYSVLLFSYFSTKHRLMKLKYLSSMSSFTLSSGL
jgi:hypothetical protein